MEATLNPTTRRATRTVPISLHDLGRRVAELWSTEPQVSDDRRAELLAALHELDDALDRLILRHDAGLPITPSRLRWCAQNYLWLRGEWAVGGLAA